MTEKVIEQRVHEHGGNIHVRFIPPEKWYKRAKWELLKEYQSYNGDILVPSGFISDGATIYWALRWLFSPTGKYFGAAIVHDWIIVETDDWIEANKQFSEEMEHLGVESWRRRLMVRAVKMWADYKAWRNS